MTIRYSTLSAMWLCLLFTIACGGSPTSPSTGASPAPQASHAPAGLPIVVSGQSNAVSLFFPTAFPALYPSAVCGGCLSNMPLSAWAPGSELWNDLEGTLHQRLTAFVWWQGETDYNVNNRNYAADERAFIARVRAANGNPHLLVALVEIIPYADNGFIRAAQEEVARTDPDVVLVKMDGIPTDGIVHLVWLPGLDNGYVAGTQRILAAIATRY